MFGRPQYVECYGAHSTQSVVGLTASRVFWGTQNLSVMGPTACSLQTVIGPRASTSFVGSTVCRVWWGLQSPEFCRPHVFPEFCGTHSVSNMMDTVAPLLEINPDGPKPLCNVDLHKYKIIVHSALSIYVNQRVATVFFPCGFWIVASRFFSVSLKVLSQGNLRRRSLQGPRSATTYEHNTFWVFVSLFVSVNFRITSWNIITHYQMYPRHFE